MGVRVTLQIPAALQWVSYLVGSQWPKGDEDAMYRIGGEWGDRAEQLRALIPELNRMRASTSAVLQGVTAGAADGQFALLFDGDASVDKLADAMAALGTLSESTGKNIEYTKLQILTSLAIAAFEISWALAQTSVTFGASAAQIPLIEGTTTAAIRQMVAVLLKDVMTDLGKAMTKTTVHRIIKKSGVEAAEALGQELFIQGVQQSKGHQNGVDWNRLGTVAVANSVGGAAQGTVSIYGQRALGNSALKGAAVGYVAGMSKKVTGALATGQAIDPVSVLGSVPTAVTGGVRGRAAAHSTKASTADGGGAAAAGGGDGD
ncbi:WXG100-like domain-containing protein [Mycolicibacterium neworleansense]|uniref:Outer membrane channel protein CpnT-like N-terminal domain-containing protein n=1 Tax=Mycolicibacterium neworleansense TaxID=146018 RepID=A0A0H5S8W2_9MYCO|nr:hypothetical protein [Mycolicibacterium neworleansense]MCV7360639.1 hypothetical protein [Mycolicibacterium neworleansense]CRZ17744.1 hypothetical protein BN2156_04636 [Mycolicibacterium neworleansense]